MASGSTIGALGWTMTHQKRTIGSAPDAPPSRPLHPPPLHPPLHPPLRRRYQHPGRHRRSETELGQHKGRRKAGRPAKESAAVGKTNKRVMTTPDRQARRATAQRFSTASKRRRPNPPSGKTHSYPTVRLDRLDPDRFILIKNLHRHPAWDFQDKKKGGVRQQDHRCQVCRAIGPIWHGKYRGGSAEPARVKIMCGCEQCPAGFCSMACFNKWHYDNEMPPIED